ncbi:MAG: hypothetical protein HY392_05560, partial [Candidatus Diapherotrites archaeon]|nr:hypothetical protein [Candidatus Diapherotrites archaeon]
MVLNVLVVDANVFAAGLLKDSFTRRFLLSDNAPSFFAPFFLNEELLKYSAYFSKKLSVPEKIVILGIEQLLESSHVKIIEKKEYEEN